MGRVNKTIDGAFIDIVGNLNEMSLYDKFIEYDTKEPKSKELNDLIEIYKKLILEYKTTFELLASLEEIIIQMRIRENMEDIKLSQVREYLYARVPFYRKDRKSKDIRVLVGNEEFYPIEDGNIESLFQNEKFMEIAKKKLQYVMDSEIKENIRTLKLIYQD